MKVRDIESQAMILSFTEMYSIREQIYKAQADKVFYRIIFNNAEPDFFDTIIQLAEKGNITEKVIKEIKEALKK